MRTFIVTTVALLATASTALAGGWATVELSSTPHQAAGGTWKVDMTILQHGVTPLENIEPVVTINSGTDPHYFTAVPTGEPGVYRANVVFPREGKWRYEIWDGFSQTHTYPAVEIRDVPASAGTPGQASPDDGFPWTALVVALAAGMAAAGLTLMAQRRRSAGLAP